MQAQARYRQLGGRGKVLAGVGAAVLACVFAMPGTAHASVAVLLEQPYGKLGRFDTAGHSAIYLDHVCAETPVKLRACREGELGVVISRYDGIDKKDWVAMPLMAYLYAVDSAAEIPLSMDKAQETALRDKYRRAHLTMLAPDTADGKAPGGNWYELAGAGYDRTIYGFSLLTTRDQEAKLIADFNDGTNVQEYNGFFDNCADFARTTINRFYPHAVRRNYIADGGLTSPKQVARGVSRYAKKHPEAGLQVFVIPQVVGTLPRSHANQDAAEAFVKRYGIPVAVIYPPAEGVFVLAYVIHGRFAMPKGAPVMDLRTASSSAAVEALVEKPAAEKPTTEKAGVLAVAESPAGSVGVSADAGAAASLRATSMVVGASH